MWNEGTFIDRKSFEEGEKKAVCCLLVGHSLVLLAMNSVSSCLNVFLSVLKGLEEKILVWGELKAELSLLLEEQFKACLEGDFMKSLLRILLVFSGSVFFFYLMLMLTPPVKISATPSFSSNLDTIILSLVLASPSPSLVSAATDFSRASLFIRLSKKVVAFYRPPESPQSRLPSTFISERTLRGGSIEVTVATINRLEEEDYSRRMLLGSTCLRDRVGGGGRCCYVYGS